MDWSKILGLVVLAIILISPLVASNEENFDVDIEVSDKSVAVNREIQFVASVSGDVSVDSFKWDFDDGSSAVGDFVTHSYDDTGDYDVELTVESDSGNKRYAETTVTVTEFTSSVIKSVDKIEIYISGKSPGKTIETVQEGKMIIVNVKPWKSTDSITQFKTSTKNYLGNIYVKVNRLGGEPVNVTDIPNSYTFTDLILRNAEEDEIANSTVEFRVEKEWMSNMSADSDDIILKRNVEDSWEDLETEPIREEEDFHYFESSTSGFSIFAIAAKPRFETSTEVDKNIADSIFEDLSQEEFNELVIGKLGSENASPSFTRNSMEFAGDSYQSVWKSEDYGLIEPKSQRTYIVGTHRFGTEAALMLYDKVNPTETTLVRWEDENNDQEVQWSEVETVRE